MPFTWALVHFQVIKALVDAESKIPVAATKASASAPVRSLAAAKRSAI
jgi:hypothetical protein